MISDNKLKEIVSLLISYKCEGGYWDFKREWYSENNTSDMLIDIICLANNLENRDAYIIIGVDESNDYSITDVSKDKNRRDTQKVTDFLHSKQFAGGFVPSVVVRTIEIDQALLDVIIIQNSINTPFYLSDRYQKVEQGNIYCRFQDTNTPVDKTAEWPYVEQLWAKHFGLNMTSLEKVYNYIKRPKDWVDWPLGNPENKQYYKYAPEFTIEFFLEDDFTGVYTYKGYDRDDIYAVVLQYFDTRLCVFPAIYYGEKRFFVVLPEKHTLVNASGEGENVYCFVKESLRYAVLQYYLSRIEMELKDRQIDEDISLFMSDIYVFESEYERDSFLEHQSSIDECKKSNHFFR